MKVTKQGDPDLAKIYEKKMFIAKFCCRECGCEFQYDKREPDCLTDIRVVCGQRDEEYYYSTCPCCGNPNVVATH